MEKGWTLAQTQPPSSVVKPEEDSGYRQLLVNVVDSLSSHGHRLKEIDSPFLDKSSISDLNVNIGLHLLTRSDQSMVDDGVVQSDEQDNNKPNNQVEVLKKKLAFMKEENERLKATLSEVNKRYKCLESEFKALLEQRKENHNLQLVTSEESKIELNNNHDKTTREPTSETSLEGRKNKRETTLDPREQGWVPNTSKISKVGPTTKPSVLDQPQGAAVEAIMRKARVSVRTRNEGTMMSDGCQWRKYGQKMAKGNPCPRSYYRCTMAVGCPVRKQVQRCADDKSVLITTYEGKHNHPLPPAALQMASATSAAATMLLSGSVPTPDVNSLMNPNFLATTFLPFSSNVATISASAPFPTVTLDLTSPLPMPDPPSQPSLFGRPVGPQQISHVLNHNQSMFSGLQTSHGVLDRDTMMAVFSAILGAGQEGSGASNISGGSNHNGSGNSGGNNS